MLEVNIRSKAYATARGDTLPAIDGVRFSVAPGEFVCLTGPSGCGKTTTLKLILGLDTDFDGQIQRPAGRMAAVFQEPRLLPWRTVEQNLRLALPDELAAADLGSLFDMVGLANAQRLYPGELSLGMARRASIARAFALEPSLLTLDEPFVSLDDATAAHLRKVLLDVWSARPTTAVMVTHNLHEAIEMADRILVMSPRPGRIIAEHRIALPRGERDARYIEDIFAAIRPSGQL